MNSESGVLETTYSVKIARVETRITARGDKIIVKAIRKKRQLFKFPQEVDEGLDCIKLINTVELAMNAVKINIIQWAKNDLLFQQFIDPSLFKNAYDMAPRSIQINLYYPLKIVKDHEEKQLAIAGAHCDNNYHFGLKKTATRLQSKFYWKKLTKDVSKYIASCDHCCQRKNSMWNV